jgi:hypothetical protein
MEPAMLPAKFDTGPEADFGREDTSPEDGHQISGRKPDERRCHNQ